MGRLRALAAELEPIRLDFATEWLSSHSLVVEKDAGSLAPNAYKHVIQYSGSGWLLYARLYTNNPNLAVELDIAMDGVLEIKKTIRELVEEGHTFWAPNDIVVRKYDPAFGVGSVGDEYIAEWTASWPGLPFRGRVALTLRNRDSANPALYSVIVYYYVRRR